MGAVYKSICIEADSLLVVVSRLAEKEINLKIEIEKLMNEGFVNIAKARYIMGSTCVTKMQLPTENSNPIKPLATVGRKKINNNWVFFIDRKISSKIRDHMVENCGESLQYDFEGSSDVTSINSAAKGAEAFTSLMQNDPNSIKKCKDAFLIEDNLYQSYNNELLDEISNTDSNESLVSVTDPIRLFGILVPRALKQAQLIFNDVVDLLGECATVQMELRETLNKFSHLEKVKGYIEAASKELKIDVLTPKVYWTPSEQSTISCYSAKLEGEGEHEDLLEGSEVSIRKTIRSVFFVENQQEQEEEESMGGKSVWGSDNTEKSSSSDD